MAFASALRRKLCTSLDQLPLSTMPSSTWLKCINHCFLATPRVWQVVLALLVCVVSKLALTPSDYPHVSLGWDKLNHFAAFASLALAAWLGFRTARQHQWISLLCLLIYGGAIEIVQLYVPGRSSEWFDLLADAIGISLGGLIASALVRQR